MLKLKQVIPAFLFFTALCWLAPTAIHAGEDRSGSFIDIPIVTPDLLLASALEVEQTDMDCSHLVHYLYQHSGLDYRYANSIALYKGVKSFRRVSRPQSGDLIVWRGHVGIVVDPEEHTFISALRTGVKVSSYSTDYWKSRGVPHFLHYVGTGISIASASID